MKIPDNLLVTFRRPSSTVGHNAALVDTPISLGPFAVFRDKTEYSFVANLDRDPDVFSTVGIYVQGFVTRLSKTRAQLATGERPLPFPGLTLFAGAHLDDHAVAAIDNTALSNYLFAAYLCEQLSQEDGEFCLFNRRLPDVAKDIFASRDDAYRWRVMKQSEAYLSARLLGFSEIKELPDTLEGITDLLTRAEPRWYSMKDKLIEGWMALEAGEIPMSFAPPPPDLDPVAGAVEFVP